MAGVIIIVGRKTLDFKTPDLKTLDLKRDKNFAAKVEDVVGLYLDPPDKALVLCVDEKSQIQALDRTQPGLPMKKGRAGIFIWRNPESFKSRVFRSGVFKSSVFKSSALQPTMMITPAIVNNQC